MNSPVHRGSPSQNGQFGAAGALRRLAAVSSGGTSGEIGISSTVGACLVHAAVAACLSASALARLVESVGYAGAEQGEGGL